MTGDAVGKLDHRSRIQLEEEFGGEIVGCRAVETKKRERESWQADHFHVQSSQSKNRDRNESITVIILKGSNLARE